MRTTQRRNGFALAQLALAASIAFVGCSEGAPGTGGPPMPGPDSATGEESGPDGAPEAGRSDAQDAGRDRTEAGTEDAAREATVLLPYGIDVRPVNATCRAPARPNADGGPGFPASLSATGCVDPKHPSEPAEGLIFYDINAPLWSDGAAKRRWLALPDGAKIKVDETGDWEFPIGTVLVKSFSLENKPVETRLFVRHEDGDWAGYSYAWRDDGSDADLLPSAERKTFGNQEWTYPSRENCLLCHTEAAGRSLGLETAQLNRTVMYAKGPANQVATFAHIGLFETDPAKPLVAFPMPTSSEGTLNDRARAYLHANCANCHRPSGVTEVNIDLRYQTPLADTRICDIEPSKGNFGFLGAKILKPGDPSLSMLSIRMHSVISGVLMPQIGRTLTDDEAVAVIDEFITGLSVCP